ncbi:hypothetical protein BJ170DRAFT_714559 [Xylariales sp. AK1849]|nr:hypothetical protein BJ170DRAFT_714559 [Xylariales sp. AK1849]
MNATTKNDFVTAVCDAANRMDFSHRFPDYTPSINSFPMSHRTTAVLNSSDGDIAILWHLYPHGTGLGERNRRGKIENDLNSHMHIEDDVLGAAYLQGLDDESFWTCVEKMKIREEHDSHDHKFLSRENHSSEYGPIHPNKGQSHSALDSNGASMLKSTASASLDTKVPTHFESSPELRKRYNDSDRSRQQGLIPHPKHDDLVYEEDNPFQSRTHMDAATENHGHRRAVVLPSLVVTRPIEESPTPPPGGKQARRELGAQADPGYGPAGYYSEYSVTGGGAPLRQM